MNIIQAKELTIETFKHKPFIPLCWVGGSGIGKTTVAKEIAGEMGLNFSYVPLRSDDVMGLNLPSKDRSEINFIPHKRLHGALDKPTLLYLDEYNRADRYTRTALMELIGERTVGGTKLHPQSVLLITMNDEGEQYDTNECDQAYKTRCIHIPVMADSELSAKWAEEQGLAVMKDWLEKFPAQILEPLAWKAPKPDPRLLFLCTHFHQIGTISSNLKNEVFDLVLGKDFSGPFKTTIEDQIKESLTTAASSFAEEFRKQFKK